jgi:hypothetical protein
MVCSSSTSRMRIGPSLTLASCTVAVRRRRRWPVSSRSCNVSPNDTTWLPPARSAYSSAASACASRVSKNSVFWSSQAVKPALMPSAPAAGRRRRSRAPANTCVQALGDDAGLRAGRCAAAPAGNDRRWWHRAGREPRVFSRTSLATALRTAWRSSAPCRSTSWVTGRPAARCSRSECRADGPGRTRSSSGAGSAPARTGSCSGSRRCHRGRPAEPPRTPLAEAWSRHRGRVDRRIGTGWRPPRRGSDALPRTVAEPAGALPTLRRLRPPAGLARAKKYGPQPVRTEARECGSGYAMERAVREGDTGLHHTAKTRRCLLDSEPANWFRPTRWSVRSACSRTERSESVSLPAKTRSRRYRAAR